MGRGSQRPGMVKEWHFIINTFAEKQLLAITDLRIREDIKKHIYGLRYEPDKQGKPLDKDLQGCHSIRAGSKRYRVVFKMKANKEAVDVGMQPIREAQQQKLGS